MINAWLMGAAGVWLLLTAFIGAPELFYVVNNLLLGLVTAVLGFTLLDRRKTEAMFTVVAGAWLALSVLVVSYGSGLWASNVISGGALILLGGGVIKKLKERGVVAVETRREATTDTLQDEDVRYVRKAEVTTEEEVEVVEPVEPVHEREDEAEIVRPVHEREVDGGIDITPEDHDSKGNPLV